MSREKQAAIEAAERRYKERIVPAEGLGSLLRTYLLHEHGLSLAEVTSRPYDRALHGPKFAEFVVSQTVGMPEAHVNLPRLKSTLANMALNRETMDRQAYNADARQKLVKASRLRADVPEIDIAYRLQESLEGEDSQPIATDVLVALGGMRHSLAIRGAMLRGDDHPASA